jgi:hypothetical protein
MSKLTRIIAIILFLAVGVLSFLPTLRISFAERPAEIPQEAADQLLDGLVKDAGGTNPISMHGLDSFAKKPGEEASTGLIVAIAIAVLALVAVIFLALGKAKAVPFLFGLLMLAALIIYWQVAKGDMLKGRTTRSPWFRHSWAGSRRSAPASAAFSPCSPRSNKVHAFFTKARPAVRLDAPLCVL